MTVEVFDKFNCLLYATLILDSTTLMIVDIANGRNLKILD